MINLKYQLNKCEFVSTSRTSITKHTNTKHPVFHVENTDKKDPDPESKTRENEQKTQM